MNEDKTGEKAREWLEKNIPAILEFSESDMAGEIVTQISDFVQFGCETLTTHQIRNLFGRIKRAQTVPEMQRARLYVAYVASKQGPGNKKLVKFFLTILEKVELPKQVRECHHFFEGIVAFHKLHFGEKK